MIQQEKIKKVSRQFCVLFGVSLALIFSLTVQAAELGITSQVREIGIGQQFQVDLMLDTEGEEINAIEAKIVFPQEFLELRQIRDGDSIISFWIERPKIRPDNQIFFSGIIPGGFQGMLIPGEEILQPGKIFSLIFKTRETDAKPDAKLARKVLIEIRDPIILLNDGKGTKAKTTIFNFQFSIFKETEVPQIPLTEIKDDIPPESFIPQIVKDPTIFEGKWFLVFASQDKDSGLLRYEIAEERAKPPRSKTPNYAKVKWIKAESPYILKDQELKSYIYVKAIDKAGNERIAVVEPKYPLLWYENYLIWIIIILGLMIIYLVKRVLWKKSQNIRET